MRLTTDEAVRSYGGLTQDELWRRLSDVSAAWRRAHAVGDERIGTVSAMTVDSVLALCPELLSGA